MNICLVTWWEWGGTSFFHSCQVSAGKGCEGCWGLGILILFQLETALSFSPRAQTPASTFVFIQIQTFLRYCQEHFQLAPSTSQWLKESNWSHTYVWMWMCSQQDCQSWATTWLLFHRVNKTHATTESSSREEGLQTLLLDLLLFYLLFCSEVLHMNSDRKPRQEEWLTTATEHFTHLFGLARLNAQFCS